MKKEFCEECSLALKRFIGKMNGVNSIETESGRIVIDFDVSKVLEKDEVCGMLVSKSKVDRIQTANTFRYCKAIE